MKFLGHRHSHTLIPSLMLLRVSVFLCQVFLASCTSVTCGSSPMQVLLVRATHGATKEKNVDQSPFKDVHERSHWSAQDTILRIHSIESKAIIHDTQQDLAGATEKKEPNNEAPIIIATLKQNLASVMSVHHHNKCLSKA